jgi:hypothetical protein
VPLRRVTLLKLKQKNIRLVIWFARHNILAKLRYNFSQLLKVLGINDVRQTAVHIAESLVPESFALGVRMATEKQKDTNHQLFNKF